MVLIWFSKIFMQLPKESVPDPDNLELWLKVWNQCAQRFLYTYRMLVHSMVIPNWVRLTGFASPQVDGEMRQKGSTKDMIFKIPFLISHISSIMTLLEGDVILTGTAYLLFPVQLLKCKYLTTKNLSPKFFGIVYGSSTNYWIS